MKTRLVTNLDIEVKKKLKHLAFYKDQDMNEVLTELINKEFEKLEVK